MLFPASWNYPRARLLDLAGRRSGGALGFLYTQASSF